MQIDEPPGITTEEPPTTEESPAPKMEPRKLDDESPTEPAGDVLEPKANHAEAQTTAEAQMAAENAALKEQVAALKAALGGGAGTEVGVL